MTIVDGIAKGHFLRRAGPGAKLFVVRWGSGYDTWGRAAVRLLFYCLLGGEMEDHPVLWCAANGDAIGAARL